MFDQAFSEDPLYLPSELLFPSSIQGFCLCEGDNKKPIVSFSCFPYIAKGRWKKDRVLRITRPLMLPCGSDLKKEAVPMLVQEIHALARRAGVYVIEAELYGEIDSRIFFPSTNCAVNTYNTPEWIGIFESHGFVRTKAFPCFELKLDEFNMGDDQQLRGIGIRKHRSDDEEDRKLYYTLWSLSDDCPYDLNNVGFWYPNVFGWPRAWYSEISHILNKDDYILFAEKDGEVVGFLHWWPNLYPLMRERGRKAIFIEESMVEESLAQIEEGKIFKIIISKKAKNDRDLIERALICETLRLMKEKFKFKRCQIGIMNRERETISSLITRNGGRKVHEIWLMRSKSFPRFG